jgi:DNA-binding Lrp family transcriptional regulator
MATHYSNILEVVQREQYGIDIIRTVKSILLDIQKLRGFSNFYGFVYTNDSYDESAIEKFRNHINEIITELDDHFKELYQKIELTEDRLGIKSDIEHLQEELSKFNSNVFNIGVNHFQKYSAFTQKTIAIITEISDKSYLFSNTSNHKTVILVDIITNIMPNLMENLGKLRAIGVQSISKKIKSLHDSTQLELYLHISQSYIEQFNRQIELYIANLSDTKEVDSIIETKNKILKEVNYFLKVTVNDVQQPDIILIDKKYYFELAEDILTIESQFYNRVFNILENSISGSVKRYRKRVSYQKVANYIMALSVVSVSGYLTYQIV